jgi:hypothetical protein
MEVGMEMPRYKCHKQVWALKIAAIEFDEKGNARIAPLETGYATFTVGDYRSKFKGDEDNLGYYVVYDDGYKSWSPAKAFESGYTRI